MEPSVGYGGLVVNPTPVTRVLASMRGEQRLIRSHGADGALLSSTVQHRPQPRQ